MICYRNLCIPAGNFTVFRFSQVVLKINYVKNLTDVTWLSNWSLRVLSKQFSIIIVKYGDGMLILGQKFILCGHNIVLFQCDFSN